MNNQHHAAKVHRGLAAVSGVIITSLVAFAVLMPQLSASASQEEYLMADYMQWNIVTFGDAHLKAESEGAVAVGGALSFDSSNTATQHSSSDDASGIGLLAHRIDLAKSSGMLQVIQGAIDLDKEKLRLLDGLTIPTIGLDSRTHDGYDASVRLDEHQAMNDAVQLLRSLGHRRLGYVELPSDHEFAFSAKLRSASFVASSTACGYSREDLLMLGVDSPKGGDSMDAIVSSAVVSLLSEPNRPTALCVETDDFAVALIARLRRFGIRVPEDMTVIGFDDSRIAPVADLTTIHQDPVHMARLAGRQAIELMGHLRMEQPHVLVGTTLILRGTSGPAPQRS